MLCEADSCCSRTLRTRLGVPFAGNWPTEPTHPTIGSCVARLRLHFTALAIEPHAAASIHAGSTSLSDALDRAIAPIGPGRPESRCRRCCRRCNGQHSCGQCRSRRRLDRCRLWLILSRLLLATRRTMDDFCVRRAGNGVDLVMHVLT